MSALDVVLHDLDLDDYTASFLSEAAAELASLRAAVAERDDAIEKAVQVEREACAKICSEEGLRDPMISEDWFKHSNSRDEQIAFTHADRIAALIRARKETEKS